MHQKNTTLKACALGASLLLALAACGSGNDSNAAAAVGVSDSALVFDSAKYTTINVTIDGAQVPVRWYREVCYVAKPVAMAATQTALNGSSTTIANTACGYQSMNIFVPESAAASNDTALYFAVNNSGWFASYIRASVADGASFDSATSHVGAALKAGYVFIDVATRSRGVAAADGSWPGKAPAPVVDAKAAIRYLRLNDARMPGSASRIVVNGTSGGGALSSIIGASGNSADYLPYLASVGAAGIDASGQSTLRDDVLAINAYCPITDLGNADLHYEWLYTAFGTRAAVGRNPNPSGSAQLAAKFSAYQQGLKLANSDGAALTADNMMDQIRQEVIRSAEVYMAAGGTIPDLGEAMPYTSAGAAKSYINDWLDVDNGARKVVSLDMEKYLKFVATQATLKAAPAFDQTGMSVTAASGESNLFGTDSQKYSNFTEYGWDNNDAHGDGIGYDDTGITGSRHFSLAATPIMTQVKLVNPMAYIGTGGSSGADTAPYWYVRHGTRDRDTAFTVSINLARALQADPNVQEVNYRLAWNQPHAGNYDVPEAMAWIAQALKAAAAKGL
ncbi:subtype B tannase [Pseudoduganella albidiflava]|uniref:Alpha/beta hydrolase n=1 Tax=Pseudoduganella albidiflava TaxID=321983 RepID=A0A411X3K8_9BURK|nr:subtype B tannase [Pseudoduganella albidiflava]QBI03589.1 hypothetical protein EYF70_24245 [Pseudoduganella albidiflava]GGY51221.1 alpha/beta hydrolase [Pseudoduganella albidiflava]